MGQNLVAFKHFFLYQIHLGLELQNIRHMTETSKFPFMRLDVMH